MLLKEGIMWDHNGSYMQVILLPHSCAATVARFTRTGLQTSPAILAGPAACPLIACSLAQATTATVAVLALRAGHWLPLPRP